MEASSVKAFHVWIAVLAGAASAAAGAEERPEAARRERLREAVEWLAAPEREGRGPGTPGIDAAAEWVARQFQAIEVRPPDAEPTAFQAFTMTLDAKLGPAAENAV